MKEIIRKGSLKSNEPHIFRCHYCNTIFKTDEYEVKPDYHNGTFYVSVCPVCNKKKAKELNKNGSFGMITSSVLDKAERAISEMPAADVHHVVRCKDCKHRKERHYEESGEKPYIKYECKFTKYSMSDDGFCSFGARMDGDTCD